MKKCPSCAKDLPDAALHCVFCGTRQPPAPGQQGLAKTAFGYSPADPVLPPVSPPATAPYTSPANNRARPTPGPLPGAPAGAPGRDPPWVTPGPPAGGSSGFPVREPPRVTPGPPLAMPPRAGQVPVSPANAATLVAPNPAPQRIQLAATVVPPAAGPGGPGIYARHPPTPMSGPRPIQPVAPVAPPPVAPPMLHIPMPRAQPPPYLASQTASRIGRPIEPWKDSLRVLMALWGAALLIAFAAPLRTSPDLVFSWDQILRADGAARLPPLTLAAVGLLSLIMAGVPMQPAVRGLIAAILGLAGIALPIALVGLPPWQPLSAMIGALFLIPGLVVRSQYRTAAVPRLLVTIGALGLLLPHVLPQSGAIPLVGTFKALIDRQGALKVGPALDLGLVTVVVMSLLAWLPSPVTGASGLWAWLLILWGLIAQVATLLVAGNLGDRVVQAPNETLVAWIAGGPAGLALGAAYLVLVGYGLASVVGKQLE